MQHKANITYVTTPIYYPNDIPHLGTAYPTIAADIIARWARLCGRETFFLTGTDEHGKKIETVASKKGVSPRELVDDLARSFKTTFQELNISYDRFIRTTDDDHIQVVREILTRVNNRGDIYKGTYEGLYCVECEASYTLEELKEKCCPVHFKPVEVLKEDCYYFCLSRYQDWLLEYYEANHDFILPLTRRREVISFVSRGLDDLCISRSTFTWGIPIPFDEGHITYVWFDALINYITGVNFLDNKEKFEKFWPVTTHLIGKDILRFHAVIWPAMLKSAGIEMPQRIFAHGFWTVNGRKFSKSLGNTILPSYLINKYGLDTLRYYMFREFPFGSDGDFSELNLVQRNNSELAQGLGNLLQRTTTMVMKYRNGKIPLSIKTESIEIDIVRIANETLSQVNISLGDLAFHKALDAIWHFVHHLNAYVNVRQPWVLAKRGEDDLLDTVLAYLAEGLRFLSVLVAPFMPESALAIAKRIGLPNTQRVETLTWGTTLTNNLVEQCTPLFKMLDLPTETTPAIIGHSAEEEVLELGISYCIAQINHIKVRKEVPQIEQRKRDIEAKIKALGHNWINVQPEAFGYQELYKRIGKFPGEIKSGIESLSGYILDSELGRLPQINVVVDLYNVYSVMTCLSIGAHDQEKIRGPIRLEFARDIISYYPIGSTQKVDIQPGEYYWRDDTQVLCRLDIKQGEATKVDEHTRHIILIVSGNATIPLSTLRKKTEELCKEIIDLCGGIFQIVGVGTTN